MRSARTSAHCACAGRGGWLCLVGDGRRCPAIRQGRARSGSGRADIRSAERVRASHRKPAVSMPDTSALPRASA